MEVSSHAIDQYRNKDINFEIAAFTNITPEHLIIMGLLKITKIQRLSYFNH